jgi:hypothetical protein
MEIITQPELRKTPEQIKRDAFSEVLRSVLFRHNQEAPTIKTFDFSGKGYPIDTAAAAVKALGQLPVQMAQQVYNEAI